MNITEQQAKLILEAFVWIHGEGKLQKEEKDFASEIFKMWPKLDNFYKSLLEI
jgi:hypothetical protein